MTLGQWGQGSTGTGAETRTTGVKNRHWRKTSKVSNSHGRSLRHSSRLTDTTFRSLAYGSITLASHLNPKVQKNFRRNDSLSTPTPLDGVTEA